MKSIENCSTACIEIIVATAKHRTISMKKLVMIKLITIDHVVK